MKIVLLVYLIGVLVMWLLMNGVYKGLTNEDLKEDKEFGNVYSWYKNPRFAVPFVQRLAWPIMAGLLILMCISSIRKE